MQCIIKCRATTPEQKALRLTQIMDVTAARFSTLSYEEVNLKHIAADVGITKAALYRYFRNKETLFLAVYIQEFELLAQTAKKEMGQVQLTDSICNTLIKHPLFCKLSAIMHTALQCNLTLDEAREFKTTLLHFIQQYAAMISAQYALSIDQATALLLQVQQVIIGCWHMSHSVGAVAEVIKEGPLQLFEVNFADILHSHITRLVTSYQG
ncbi:TetR/AcrR family transcriptional regulator [Moritella marina ATCC 15381]|uniref:TetR/AcrR family transcriptional regulator n=1 Tax=Moritella marina ATCC 15381 TaxID=1202962 RepID=A0A5J6WKJ4_MORMI|nr:TetR family transcriptional regulator [Moritella marina]QFI37808.1 TetR/AcrR family transcriptional regulator [Moritella marina ATCC 15381]